MEIEKLLLETAQIDYNRSSLTIGTHDASSQ